jgi:Rrf2 family protein
MNANTQFTMATHILAYLALFSEKPQSSAEIAASVGTTSALVRRVLQLLHQAGLTKGTKGVHGGAVLGRSPEKITLLDVYLTVKQSSLFDFHSNPHPNCPVGGPLPEVLGGVLLEAEEALKVRLNATTIKDFVKLLSRNTLS